MDKLIISEHCSASYVPRTRRNAGLGHVTAAFALDYTTSGEKLTKSAAGPKYFAVSPDMHNPALRLAEFIKERRQGKPVTLNIAGNGINTFSKYGWQQRDVNLAIFTILKQAHEYYPISSIISGGQTGADVAGLVTSVILDIPAEGHYPRGFRHRNQYGQDIFATEDFIRKMIEKYAQELV